MAGIYIGVTKCVDIIETRNDDRKGILKTKYSKWLGLQQIQGAAEGVCEDLWEPKPCSSHQSHWVVL